MAKGIFKLSGVANYMEQLQTAGQDIIPAAEEAVEAGAKVLLTGMQKRVPVKSGNLRRNLSYKMTTDGDTVAAEVGLLDDVDADTARYGNVMEYGTATIRPRAYISNTFDYDRARARRAMRETLRQRVEALA